MKISIVGPGSMGCLFAAKLSASGADVQLVDYKPERAERINASGVTIESAGGASTLDITASADPDIVKNSSGVIFMVKAYSTREAAARLKDSVPGGAWVMTMQNGMGNAEILMEIFGPEKVLAGTTSEGATLLGEGRVRHAGSGETSIGEFDGAESQRATQIADALNTAGIKTTTTGNVRGLLWKKLIVNVGINPVTALLRIRNGEILQKESALDVLHSAVVEAEGIAKAEGVDLDGMDAVRVVEGVADKTAKNISSMHQDVAAGRLTEIDYICGYVVRAANKNGLSAPVNRTLRNLVMSLCE